MKTILGSTAGFLWRYVSSLKLTMVLLIGLAAVSVIGSTFIPQNIDPADYERLYREPILRLITVLDLTDMYHSWWYILLLSLLVLNLLACTVRRLPHDWRLLTKPVTRLTAELERSLSPVQSWSVSAPVDAVATSASDFLGRAFAKPCVTRVDDEYHLFAQKGVFSRVGLYILHTSIIVIFCGALIGFYFGFKGYVFIDEGQGVATVTTRSGDVIDLGFSVQCDAFTVSFHANGKPKEYRSILSIVDQGATVVAKRPVIVNDPLTYGGVTLYQNSYREAAFSFVIRNRSTDVEQTVTVRSGDRLSLPNGDALVVMESIGELRGRSEDFSGPAVHVAVLPASGSPRSFVLLRDYPQINGEEGGAYRFRYQGVALWSTGLQATRDPGVKFVWVGSALLMLGIGMVFFLSHRRLWLRIGNGRVVMAGCANRNQAVFRATVAKLAAELQQLSAQ